jgi:hypothetical protein
MVMRTVIVQFIFNDTYDAIFGAVELGFAEGRDFRWLVNLHHHEYIQLLLLSNALGVCFKDNSWTEVAP